MSRWGLWMLVGAVCLVGCGSTSGATSTAVVSNAGARSTSAEKAETANGDCTAQRSEEDLRVTIYGAGEAACVKWDEEAARAAEQFWRPTHEEPHEAPVCSMGKGPLVLEIRSRSLEDAANRICARLLAKGWHEVEGPGQKDERERKTQESHEAEQQAAQEASELAKRESTEAHERAVEAAHEKAEEAALQRRERLEREREAASERAEEAKEHEEERREEQRNREETKRSEAEAARGE